MIPHIQKADLKFVSRRKKCVGTKQRIPLTLVSFSDKAQTNHLHLIASCNSDWCWHQSERDSLVATKKDFCHNKQIFHRDTNFKKDFPGISGHFEVSPKKISLRKIF